MALYATAAQLFNRYRIDTINQLANDDGVKQSRMDLLDNANIATALGDASGDIESALVVGQRYSTTDLEELNGNNASKLQRMCCDIAMVYLWERNPMHDVDAADRAREKAEKHLRQLQTGENIFNTEDAKDASLVTNEGPMSADYSRMNLLPDRTRRFYPNREGRLPTDRG